MALIIVVVAILAAYCLLMIMYLRWWKKVPGFNLETSPKASVFVSVVIAARNEEKNLPLLLSLLENQTYTHFEVIVVDDHSEDKTTEIVSSMKWVRLLQLKGDSASSSKKKAIAKGVSEARGELIVTTDADCLPSKQWLETIVAFYYETDAVFIAGPVKYANGNNIVEQLQLYDFTSLQGITAASVHANFHTMCNGANIAYRKDAFHSVGGFDGIDKVASGDDMLLMYKVWRSNPGKVRYLKSRTAIVSTQAMPTWKQFAWQRIRWASKTAYYDDKRVFWTLVLVYFTNLLFPALIIASFFGLQYLLLLAAFIIIKAIAEWQFISQVSKFYKQQLSFIKFLLLQPIHMFYIVIIGLVSQKGSYKWKGRKTK